jgi:ribosome-binding protein aMBF1 (putative translation factor)
MTKEELAAVQRPILDLLRAELGLTSDRQLAHRINEEVTVMSRMSTGRAPLGAATALRVLDTGVLTLQQLRDALGPQHPLNFIKGVPK